MTLFSLALPLVVQQLVTFSVGFVDSIMVGSLGDYAISCVHILIVLTLTMCLKFHETI